MLEQLDELYDRDDDGQFVKYKEVERIRQLAKLCPTRLRNHRVVSLELANLVAGTKYRGKVASCCGLILCSCGSLWIGKNELIFQISH